ncbi:MAG: hypothetical protein ABEH56_04405 [Salinirussus sp.]
MPVPGYDPEDIDDTLEALVDEEDVAELLSEEQQASYERGDADLVDLLDSGEIERFVGDADPSG